MKKSIVSKLAVVCLTAVVAIGGVSMPASAKSKGYPLGTQVPRADMFLSTKGYPLR